MILGTAVWICEGTAGAPGGGVVVITGVGIWIGRIELTMQIVKVVQCRSCDGASVSIAECPVEQKGASSECVNTTYKPDDLSQDQRAETYQVKVLGPLVPMATLVNLL